MKPLARAYGFILPGPAKRAVLRVFANLNAPVIFVNDVLQFAPRRAGVTLSRFVVNTTVGIVGILDVATGWGLEGHHSDFGQTLGVAGVPTGPYLVLPIAGPSSARDAVGGVVDLAFRPQTYFLGPIDLLIIQASGGVATREAYIEELAKLRASSLDFYTTMRNIYFQRRAEVVRAGRSDQPRTATAPAPDPAVAPDPAAQPPASGTPEAVPMDPTLPEPAAAEPLAAEPAAEPAAPEPTPAVPGAAQDARRP
jgi:phospholipid-binding lipoprotein MlaA